MVNNNKYKKLFPLDYVFLVGIAIYFLLATMMGIIQIGVRFLWVTLYRIRKGSTAPQGLLFSAILLTFGLLALNYSISSVVAPGYAHYGSQVYVRIIIHVVFVYYSFFIIYSVITRNVEVEIAQYKLI